MTARKFRTSNADVGSELAEFVASRLACSVATARSRVTGGSVYINRERVRDPRRTLAAGERVVVHEPSTVAQVPVPIVYEDARCVVVDKPAGLPSQPGRTSDMSAETIVGMTHPGVRAIHRLDQDASGLLLLGRSAAAHAQFRHWLERGKFQRHYRAVVWGHMAADAGRVDRPIGPDPTDRRRQGVTAAGKSAISEFVVVDRTSLGAAACTVVDVELITGRRHQIRVHMAALGHPLCGDALYSSARVSGPTVSQLALLSRVLEWPGQRVELSRTLNILGLSDVT